MTFVSKRMSGTKTLLAAPFLGSLLLYYLYLAVRSKPPNTIHPDDLQSKGLPISDTESTPVYVPISRENSSYVKSMASLLSFHSDPTFPETVQTASVFSKYHFKQKEKLILLWSPNYGTHGLAGWFATNETFKTCPFKCNLSVDKTMYNVSDAIIYDGLSYYTLPSFRAHPDQIWMIFRIESPAHHYDMSAYNNMFNWTITYRLDSDVTWDSNVLVPSSAAGKNPPQKVPSLKSLKTKKLIAWIVSNCITPGRREKYVKELSNHVKVDVFGKCGTLNLPCKNRNFNTECYKYIAKEYKFYLAFENSICEDYVTEKLWYPLRFGIIPIVYGHPSFKKVAPPGSYINVDDFKSPEELAIYLDYLNKNSTQYLKYFEWTKKYVILGILESFDVTWCKICSKLHKTDLVKDRKVYPSVHRWFNNNSTGISLCSGPKIFTSS